MFSTDAYFDLDLLAVIWNLPPPPKKFIFKISLLCMVNFFKLAHLKFVNLNDYLNKKGIFYLMLRLKKTNKNIADE